MCGLAGQITLRADARPDPDTVARMTRSLAHRGPDGEGFADGDTFAFGHRRLAVIDLAGGSQPMSSHGGRYVAVFNGEIYNHAGLRRELEARGHTFRTRSEIEVLLAGYAEWGARLVERLEGMFALCVVDTLERRALLARDPAGKKPLHLLEHDGSLWFASEPAALNAIAGWSRELDPVAVDHYLATGSIPPPLSIHRAVRKLPPASSVEIVGERRTERRYWDPPWSPKLRSDLDHCAEVLRAELETAVKRRLESEVPMGAFLSGGVDSSGVVALMARASTDRVRTFTVGFEGDSHDERPYAREIAKLYDTEHHEILVRPDAAADLPRALAGHGEPFADDSALPMWYLAREARRHATVVLCGDGADDLFAGYSAFRARPIGLALSRLPDAPRRRFERFALDVALAGGVGSDIVRRAVPIVRTLASGRQFTPIARARLYRPEFAAALAESAGFDGVTRASFERHAGLPTRLDRQLAIEQDRFLAGDLLPKADIATMAHGLEARSPFLDRRVMELARRMPDAVRVRGRTTKAVVKHALRDVVPAALLHRRKQGFAVPVDDWLRGELAPMAREVVLARDAGWRAFARPAEVERMVADHQQGRARHGRRLWALLCFEIWARSAARSPARRQAPVSVS